MIFVFFVDVKRKFYCDVDNYALGCIGSSLHILRRNAENICKIRD
jgi:hypothetical protein